MADISKIKLPDNITYNIKDSTKLPLAGGTMSGQIKTSFKSSVATGSQQADASTIPDLCTELRYSSGVMGSVSISTSYTKDGVTIATGWYNFLWVPHRSGGVNGQASGDNCDYGSLYLSGMTTSGCYLLRFANGNIAELKDLYKDTNTTYALSTSGNNVVLTPSSGSANTITVPYATSAGSASPTSGSAYYIQNNVGSSRSTATSGSWMSMVNSSAGGSPVTPTAGWWTVLSADCWNSAPNNWVSQLALPTQDTSGVWWRRNDSGGTSIDSSAWRRLAEGDSDGNALYAISAGSATDSTKMPLAGGTFTGIVTHNKSIHGSGGDTIYGAEARNSQWYKLTLATNGLTPPSSSNQWYMCSFTLNMAGDYGDTPKGSIYVSYYIYWNKSTFSADKVFATAFGNNMNKVKVYYKLTEPFILYIESSNTYSAMWVDKISYRDSGNAYRTLDTILEATNAISTSGYSTIPTACFYTYDGSQFISNNSILPDSNNNFNLGASNKKWANGYFTNINGVAVGDSPKFTDNNTTYTLGTSSNNVTLTPSSGSVQNITVPYATNAGTVNNLTVQTAVPANAVFTDTKVTQTVENGGSTSGDYYGILLANTKLSDSTETASVKKTPSSDLAYSPTDHKIRINGKTSSYGANIGGFIVYSVNNNGVNIEPDGINLFDTSYNDTITLTNTTGAITATSLNGVTIGSSPKFTDTHRTVKIDSSEVLGDNTTPLNLISGTGIRLAQWAGSGGSGIVINATGPSVTDISDQYTFTRTSGPWTCQGIRAVRCGNVVTMQVIIKGGSSVSDGSNGIQGTISGGPLPARVNGGTQDMGVQGINFYGVSALVGQLNSSGTFTLRLLIHSQSMGSNSTSISFTFVCD